MISAFKVVTVQEILKMLKPFETVTIEIFGEKYPMISKVIPMIYLLRGKVNELNAESDIGKHLKKYLLQKINARFSNIENNEHYMQLQRYLIRDFVNYILRVNCHAVMQFIKLMKCLRT